MHTAALANPTAHEQQHHFHIRLNQFNSVRLTPAIGDKAWQADLRAEYAMRAEEAYFVEHERRQIQRRAAQAPVEARAFVRWFENLRESGPG